MGNDQADIGELLLDLSNLSQVYRILQSAVTGNVEHHNSAHSIQHSQLMLGEEIEDPNLRTGNILGAQAQIGLHAQKAALTDMIFEKAAG